jgi:hypothetical protein
VARDIMATGITVVAVGDPGQLPPINGDPFFTRASFQLTEIHRQALESPIIRQAHAVRAGGLYMPDGDEVRVVSKLSLTDLGAADILTGRRTTRMAMNAKVREILGRTSPFPKYGEPIVCLRNLKKQGLVNGGIYYASRDFEEGDKTIGISTDDGDLEVRAVFLPPGHEYDRLDDLPVWLTAGRVDNGIISRSQEYLIHRPGRPASVLLDFDTKGMPPSVALVLDEAGGFWPALVAIVPELKDVARVERASTGAGLFDSRSGAAFGASGGRHVYIIVKDGTDSGRFLKTLHERCWLAGLGWMMVGAGGQLLERSIVDRVCGTPERLAFEGSPVLEPPIAQDAASRQPIAADGEPLDSIVACPPLSLGDIGKLKELRAKETHRLATQSAKAREAFVERQSDQLVGRTGMDPRRARRTIERQCEGVLLPDVELPFDEPELAGKIVRDVLADPSRFEGETLADPLEGVAYGRCKARIMRRGDGSVWINSFAHGRTVYELSVDYTVAKAALEKTKPEDAVEMLQRMVRLGDLGIDEIELLRNLAHEISGIGRRTLDRKLKQSQSDDQGSDIHLDLINAFNAQYAVVSEAGKAMVYERVRDPMLDRHVLIRSRFEDFRKFYQNMSVEIRCADGSLKNRSAGDFWLDHRKRRQYLGGVVFDPPAKVGPEYWNLWSGFGVEPKPGTWSLMQDHLLRVICGGNRNHFDFLLNTTARMFQEPSKPAEVAVVLRGKKGSGKGVF